MIETDIARDRATGDLVDLLVADHEEWHRLFSAYLGTPLGDPERKVLMQRITALLVAHGAAEEACLYPELRRQADGGAELARLGLDRHAQTDVLLRKLAPLDARAPGFDRMAAVLHEHVSGQMHWEEARLFPLLRDALGQAELYQLADRARTMREHPPTVPPAHPGVQAPTDHFWPPQLNAAGRFRYLFTPAGGWSRMLPH